jgi:hypothetical protein
VIRIPLPIVSTCDIDFCLFALISSAEPNAGAEAAASGVAGGGEKADWENEAKDIDPINKGSEGLFDLRSEADVDFFKFPSMSGDIASIDQ